MSTAPISLRAQRKKVTLRSIQHVQFPAADLGRLTERAVSEAAAGRLRPVIEQEF